MNLLRSIRIRRAKRCLTKIKLETKKHKNKLYANAAEELNRNNPTHCNYCALGPCKIETFADNHIIDVNNEVIANLYLEITNPKLGTAYENFCSGILLRDIENLTNFIKAPTHSKDGYQINGCAITGKKIYDQVRIALKEEISVNPENYAAKCNACDQGCWAETKDIPAVLTFDNQLINDTLPYTIMKLGNVISRALGKIERQPNARRHVKECPCADCIRFVPSEYDAFRNNIKNCAKRKLFTKFAEKIRN
jgi:hypothetical protein